MRRVDDRADALGCEIGGQPLRPAEAADAPRNWRRLGLGGYARKRQNWRNIRLTRDPPRERGALRRAAENEQAKAVQGAAP